MPMLNTSSQKPDTVPLELVPARVPNTDPPTMNATLRAHLEPPLVAAEIQ